MDRTIENRLVWLNGNIMELPDAKINILSPSAQFGANVFEGLRCYWNAAEQQLYAFRLDEHYKRLRNSAKLFRLENEYSEEEMRQAFIDVIHANDYKEDLAVRQTIFLNGFGSWSSHGPTGMFVAPIPRPRLTGREEGLRCCVSSWERISDKNISPKVKAGANYINSRMAQMEAKQNGYDSAIFLNHEGKVAEGPGSCLFIIRGGKLITPPHTSSVLESITRDTVIELAASLLNLETIEREIDRTELYMCDEAFLCGTSMEVRSIKSVDGYEVAQSKITSEVLTSYLDVASGMEKGYKSWLTPVF